MEPEKFFGMSKVNRTILTLHHLNNRMCWRSFALIVSAAITREGLSIDKNTVEENVLQLTSNIARNVVREYERTGSLWEQCDDVTGKEKLPSVYRMDIPNPADAVIVNKRMRLVHICVCILHC